MPCDDHHLRPAYPVDPATDAIAKPAVGPGEGRSAQSNWASSAARSTGAKLAKPATENRGGESTLGNLVAEVQRWATEKPESGSAQIAFMNPGGLRTDMLGTDPGDGAYPRTLTYEQAAVVQPFANTLVNMQLTGAQIKTVLEQQWQRDALNKVPTRTFLRLGVSEGFEYTYTQQTAPEYPLDDPKTADVDESQDSVQRHARHDHRHVAERRADRSGRDLLGDGELVPLDGRRQLPRARQRHGQARHRQGRPRRDGGLHGHLRRDDAAAGRLRAARGRGRVPGRARRRRTTRARR